MLLRFSAVTYINKERKDRNYVPKIWKSWRLRYVVAL